MTINKCRVCNHNFFEEPLLKLKNMPATAQYLPDAKSLKNDKGIDIEVCQCSCCGLVQLTNEPVNYYREAIRSTAVSEEMKNFRKKQFGRFIKRYSLNGKKIVEIGCGKGEYLSIMQKCDVKVYGLEEAVESVQHCAKNGLNVSRGFIKNSTDKINHAPFNAFFILNFLEHLPNPNSTLRGIYNNLTDNAIGIIEVPNFDMILRKNLFSEFMRDHLIYFTGETLKATLNFNGFETIECNNVRQEYITSAIVKKRKRLVISHFNKHQEKLKTELKEYIDRFGDNKVAIWGAGHQALAVISLMDLTGKVKYVVDSATFKQGKYTPVTHIPIVSPESLNSDPVEAIIIMAASYSDEIAKIVRQRYDTKLEDEVNKKFDCLLTKEGSRIKKRPDIAILRDYGLESV